MVNDFDFPGLHDKEFEVTVACGKKRLAGLKRLERRKLAQCRDLCVVELGKRGWIISVSHWPNPLFLSRRFLVTRSHKKVFVGNALELKCPCGSVCGNRSGLWTRVGQVPLPVPCQLHGAPSRDENVDWPSCSSSNAQVVTKVPWRSSCSVCSISSAVFITKGPYRAIGSQRFPGHQQEANRGLTGTHLHIIAVTQYDEPWRRNRCSVRPIRPANWASPSNT